MPRVRTVPTGSASDAPGGALGGQVGIEVEQQVRDCELRIQAHEEASARELEELKSSIGRRLRQEMEATARDTEAARAESSSLRVELEQVGAGTLSCHTRFHTLPCRTPWHIRCHTHCPATHCHATHTVMPHTDTRSLTLERRNHQAVL